LLQKREIQEADASRVASNGSERATAPRKSRGAESELAQAEAKLAQRTALTKAAYLVLVQRRRSAESSTSVPLKRR
jgi:hypothetical protein